MTDAERDVIVRGLQQSRLVMAAAVRMVHASTRTASGDYVVPSAAMGEFRNAVIEGAMLPTSAELAAGRDERRH